MSSKAAVDNPTREIARYVSELTYDDLPDVAVENAKLAILDTVGVTLAGSRAATSKLIQNYVRTAGEDGQATIFGTDIKASPELASLANGVSAHILDFDDRWHSSTHTLPAALALAEANGLGGRELLLSYVVGREVRLHFDAEFRAGRGGDSEQGGSGPGWRGWHETGVFGSLGAAAAAAKILHLDTYQTQMALGIAASLASGLMANFGTSTKSLHAGNAARNGVVAASLAFAGFTADSDILGARRGLIEAITYPEDRSASDVADSLHSYFHIVENGVRIKPYPSCTGTHQFIEMMRKLREDHGVGPEDVEKLTVSRIEGATTKRDFPETELECRFSPAFVAIATLVDGKLTLGNCSLEFLHRPDVQDLLGRTQYVDAESGFLQIDTYDGRTLLQPALPSRHPAGSPAFDLEDEEEINAKFHDCVDSILGARRAKEIESMLQHLQELDSVPKLTALMKSV